MSSTYQNFNPGLLALLGLGGAGAGSFGQPSSSNTNGSGTTNNWSNTSGSTSSGSYLQNLLNTLQQITGQTAQTQTTTPNLNPASQAFIQQLTQRYGNLTAPSLTGYQAGQTGLINANSDLQKRAVGNIMASRGLSTSPVAATSEANIEQNRLNQITGLNQQIPLLQQQYNLQNLGAAASLAGILPALSGVTTTGTGTTAQSTTGSQVQNQQATTAAQTNQQTVGQNQNIQNQQTKSSQGGGLGGLISGGLSAILPFLLLSDERLKKDVKPVDKAISKLRELKPKAWKWKGGDRDDLGFIAQDIEDVLPQLVDTTKVNGVELKKVNYAGIIPILVSAVQELDRKVA